MMRKQKSHFYIFTFLFSEDSHFYIWSNFIEYKWYQLFINIDLQFVLNSSLSTTLGQKN